MTKQHNYSTFDKLYRLEVPFSFEKHVISFMVVKAEDIQRILFIIPLNASRLRIDKYIKIVKAAEQRVIY